MNSEAAKHKNSDLLILSTSLFLLFFISIFLYFADFNATTLLTSTLFFIFLTICLIPFFIAIKNKKIHLEEPIYWVSILYFIFFGVRAIYLLSGGENISGIVFDYYEMVNPMLIVVSIGLFSMICGYYLVKSEKIFFNKKRSKKVFEPNNSLIFNILVLTSIGAIIQIVFILKGYQTSFEAGLRAEEVSPLIMAIGYLHVFSTMGYLFLLGIYYKGFRPNYLKIVLWGVVLPLEIFFAFTSGSKTRFFPIIIAPILIKSFYEKKVPWKGLIIAAFVIFFLVFPLVNMYREACAVIYSDDSLKRIYLVLEYMLDKITKLSFGDYFMISFKTIMNRISGFDSLALVLKYTPEVMPFQYGKTIIAAPLILIPTILWPNKYHFLESIASGVRFGEEYYGISGNTSGVSITQIGELYLNFQIFGVIIGMFLMGAFFRLIHRYWVRGGDPLCVGAYVLLFTLFVPLEYWFATGYGILIKQLILVSIVIYFIRRLYIPVRK